MNLQRMRKTARNNLVYGRLCEADRLFVRKEAGRWLQGKPQDEGRAKALGERAIRHSRLFTEYESD